MFKCDKCGESFKRPHRVILKTRTKVYEGVNPRHSTKNDYQNRYAQGWEIVKEANLCDKCYEEGNYGSKSIS